MLVSGELGTGKTTLVRGAARALGVTAPVTSPTFTIGHRYRGRVDVSHLDLYRFHGVSAAEWGDLEPYFDGAVVFVEWPEAGAGRAPGCPPARRPRARRRRRARESRSRPRTRRCYKASQVLILAFDTATDVATSALVDDGEVLGERTSIARTLLEDIDALLRQASARPADVDAIAVGTGPGSFTSTRMGLAVARGLALALDVPVAGVSTLDALAAAGDDALPGDRRAPRRGVRSRAPRRRTGERRRRRGAPCASVTAPGATATCSRRPEPSSRRTTASSTAREARFHAALATDFGPAELVEPVYVRVPDVDLPRT